MKEQILIFGVKDTAQLAKFYLENDSAYKDRYNVIGFVINESYRSQATFENLPVFSFETIESLYDPNTVKFFAPMTGIKMNSIRKAIYAQIKKKGYEMISYVSSKSSVFTEKIGDNCFILEDNTIQPFVEIGNNVVLWSGNHIGHHSKIGDHVFFTSHVVLSGHCHVKDSSWFGVNTTIRDATVIGCSSLIAMGSLVTKDTDDFGFYMGSPAKKQIKSSIEAY
jgi:sugar O-acyltransferase (sialic acid O-acetyltransferase NeuD family)